MPHAQTLRPAGQPVTSQPGEEEFRRAVAEVESGLAVQRQLGPSWPSRRAAAAAAGAARATPSRPPCSAEGDTEIGSGKFVLLFDAAGQHWLGWEASDHRLRPGRA